MPQVTVGVDLTTMTCPSCGVIYGINERVREDKQRLGGSFFCTNGHSLTYTETEIDKLRKRAANLQDDVNVAYAARDAAERKLRRVQAGTCPHCNRHFVNVERHMKSKHKDRG